MSDNKSKEEKIFCEKFEELSKDLIGKKTNDPEVIQQLVANSLEALLYTRDQCLPKKKKTKKR